MRAVLGGASLTAVALALVAVQASAREVRVVVDNMAPRHNMSGSIMDAHDGSYNFFEGSFYTYAMGYGTCKQGGDMCHGCGYGYSWIGVWKSPDLSNNSWTLVREARDASWPRGPRVGAYFRSHVVQCPSTKDYVLWVNVNGAPECHPSGPCYYVGTSSSPEGPFAYKGAVNPRFKAAGDFDILVDDDGAGYLIYTATQDGHQMSIERLAADFLSSLAPSGVPAGSTGPTNVSSGYFGHEFVEAPAIFKRGGVYYALFGKCCCFCGHGSGIGVYTASQPLGPWTYHENIGCTTSLATGCGCGMNDPDHDLHCPALYGTSLTKAQQNYVFPVQTPNGTVHLWTGDRWQSASDGIKAHDLQFWSPIEFVHDPASGLDLPRHFSWIDNFTLDLVLP